VLMRRAIPFYPLVLVAFPAVFLYAHNASEGIRFTNFIVPFTALMGVVTLFVLILRLIIKDSAKVSALIGILILVTFFYGPIKDIVWREQLSIAGVLVGRHTYLIPTATALALILGSITLLYRGNLATLMRAVTVGVLILLVFNAGRIVLFELEGLGSQSKPVIANGTIAVPVDRLPDIYYIVLDGYARADSMERVYGFDNSEFLDSLIDKGFYIASESQSNYINTKNSLSSSMNMRYLDISEHPHELIPNNALLDFVQSIGYTYVHMDSGYVFTRRNRNADVEFIGDNPLHLLLNDYSAVVLKSTIIQPIARSLGFNIDSPFAPNLRKLFQDSMENLKAIPHISGPTFTFSHNLPPHPPYVFDRNGNTPRDSNYEEINMMWKDIDLYVDEIVYINNEILEVVDEIMERSKIEPIIVVQGDHGTALNLPYSQSYDKPSEQLAWERPKILNAYYFPQSCNSNLYPDISPVNSFRVIFNSCLGTDFDILEDETFYSRRNQLYVTGGSYR